MPRDVQTIVDRMSDDDWQSLTLQLGRYAVQKSRRFYWRTGSSGELPDGERTESLVSKAVVLWLSGRRRWNPSQYEDLQAFLKGVIDSLLSHSANGHDNRTIPDGNGGAPVLRTTPESHLLQQERQSKAEAVLSAIVQRSQSDRVILEIIDAIRDGAGTRRDIAKATGLTAADVDNGLKRLRRLGASVVRSKEYETHQAR
jgi:hypothetical protein